MQPRSSSEKAFYNGIAAGLTIANSFFGGAFPTHRRKGVLDVILCSPDIFIKDFHVSAIGVASSDHAMITLSISWQPPPVDDAFPHRWVYAKNWDKQWLYQQIEPSLAGLHGWIKERIDLAHPQSGAQVAFLCSVIVLGTIWQRDSPLGRFTTASRTSGRRPTHWWNAQCQTALRKWQQERGKPRAKQYKTTLRAVVRKAKTSGWSSLVKTWKSEHQSLKPGIQPKLHRTIKKAIRPQGTSPRALRVDNKALSESESRDLWTRHLASQVSLDGPRPAAKLLPSASQSEAKLPFDDTALRQMRAWEQEEAKRRRQSVSASPRTLLSFVEICDAQHKLSQEAAVSPLDQVPVAAVCSPGACNRSVVTAIMNLFYQFGVPAHIGCVPILPILKPGKNSQDVANYRPISLMAALLKLYDRILFDRTRHFFEAAEDPWQGGGNDGADERAWLLCQIVSVIRKQHPSAKIYACFLDGESAFCRPPPCAILRGASSARVPDADWLAIRDFLHCLTGTAIIANALVGKWKVHCGAPQGGSLSGKLFQSTLLALQRRLASAGVGVTFLDEKGREVSVPCLAFVDDLVIWALNEHTPSGRPQHRSTMGL